MNVDTTFHPFDSETSGLEPGSRLIELAAQRVDLLTGEVLATFCELINPGMPLPADAQAVNRIDPATLAAARPAKAVLADWLEFMSGTPQAVAHFARYDVGIISWELGRSGLPLPAFPVFCTWEHAKALQGQTKTKDNKLQTLVAHHKLTASGDAHRALADVETCRQLHRIQLGMGSIPPVRPWQPLHFATFGSPGVPLAYATPEQLGPKLAALPELVATGQPFSFGYKDAKGELTYRTIVPFGWAMIGGEVQFHGLCKMRGERRTFKLAGVQ